MAFPDPQTVTVNSVAKVMALILSDGSNVNNIRKIYQLSDQTFTLTISQQTLKKGGKTKLNSMVRLDQRKIVANPLGGADADSDYDTQSWWFVYERPEYGFDATECANLGTGLKTWLDSTAMGKLFGRES